MPFQSVADEMHRFKHGQLHSGKGGPVVKSRAQAIAIALSEKRRAEGGDGEEDPREKKRKAQLAALKGGR